MKRTNTCNELTSADKGKSVTLIGWVQSVRDHGGMEYELTTYAAAWNAGQLPAYRYRILADRLRGVLCASQPIAWGTQYRLTANVSSEMRTNQYPCGMECALISNALSELPTLRQKMRT